MPREENVWKESTREETTTRLIVRQIVTILFPDLINKA